MTVRDVVTVLQRAEMVRRIAEEIEGYVVELGLDGRLVELQLEELTGGVRADLRLVGKDYFVESPEWMLAQVTTRLARHLRRRAARSARRRVGAAPAARARSRLVAAAARLPVAQQDPAPARGDRRARHRAVRHAAQGDAARASPISSRSKASARRGHARSRTGCRASRRRRSSIATPELSCSHARGRFSPHGSTARRSGLRRHRRDAAARRRRPRGRGGARPARRHAAVAGLVLHPDIGGLRPAVRGHGAPARDARARGVRRSSRSRRQPESVRGVGRDAHGRA